MYMKIHHAPGAGDVVAVCDRELLNTTLSHGELEVCISDRFYGDIPVTEDEVRSALAHAENANIMGTRSVAIAVSLGMVNREHCIMIGTVPHAQIFRL